MKHASHPSIIKRLKRAGGHLRSVTDMFEKDRSCLDLAQQLHAVEKAVASAKRELIHDHIEHCLDDGSMTPKAALKELKALTKYL
jgi:DNA-binding FrmR family transcriptional regulator